MRNAFIKTLEKEAAQHPELFLIVGDLGYGVIENFEKQYPKQFLNAGVSEQNMTGMAAGLAMSGKTVFTYSIGNFPTLRPFEQIRADICYHNANVKVVTMGGGWHYNSLGASHHATEDLAVTRALPNMTVLAPGDPVEAELMMQALITTHKGPAYLRLSGRPVIHTSTPHFEIGKAITVRPGRDLTIISTGGMLDDAMKAAQFLSEKGLDTQVISMHTIKPIDSKAIIEAAKNTQHIFTLEDHNIIGGLGGAVSEVLAESGACPKIFKRFGIKDTFIKDVGTVEYMKQQLGLDWQNVGAQILALLGK